MVLSVTDYIIKVSKRSHIRIDDPYDYFKASAERNIRALELINEGGGIDIRKELEKLSKTMGVED